MRYPKSNKVKLDTSRWRIDNFMEYGEQRLDNVVNPKNLKKHYKKHKIDFRDLLVVRIICINHYVQSQGNNRANIKNISALGSKRNSVDCFDLENADIALQDITSNNSQIDQKNKIYNRLNQTNPPEANNYSSRDLGNFVLAVSNKTMYKKVK